MKILPHIPELTDIQIKHFFEKITKVPSGCWLWIGAVNSLGYGGVSLNQRYFVAHRVSYEYLIGEIPDGLFLDHLCRVHNCVNPDHLEPVTPQENILRGISPMARNAKKTHCPRGHAYDETNTNYHKTGRECIACRRYDKDGNIKYTSKREKTHCTKGHEYTEENTYWHNNARGSLVRTCKTCKYIFNQRYNKDNSKAS